MRILFLTQVLPYPLDAGPKVRAYYVLRHLAQHHEITLVSFMRPTDTPEALAHLASFCKKIYTIPMPRALWRNVKDMIWSLIVNQPFLIVRDQLPEMTKLRQEIMAQEQFDAIHADQLWMAPYALAASESVAYQPRPMTVLDQHNAVYLIPQRMSNSAKNLILRQLMYLEARKLALFERKICAQMDHVVWVTAEDYDALQRIQASRQAEAMLPLRNSGVIPICTDAVEAKLPYHSPTPRRITFLGGLHYPPNAEGILWFAKTIFPTILAAVPDACLTVIGKEPPAELTACGIPAANLEVTGYVADPAPYLAETAVFIVPLLAGGGMRVKILDAWKWELPVVSTTVGAEGIHITPSHDILIADIAADFAAATIYLLQNPAAARALACAAHASLQRDYDWRNVYQAWDKIYAVQNEPSVVRTQPL